MNIQRTILAKLIRDKNAEVLMSLDNSRFTGEHLRILSFVKDFISDNGGKMPTRKIIARHFGSEFSNLLTQKISEPVKYLMDQLDDAYTYNNIVDVINEASKQLKKKGEISPKDVLKFMEKNMLTLRSEVTQERQKGQDITKRKQSIRDRLNERRKKGGIVGYHLPFPSLTKQLRGLRKKRLYTLIARTSVGKTVLSFLIALHVWRQYNCPVVFLSGELDFEQMEDMFLSFVSGLPISKLENGDLSDKEMDILDKKLTEIETKHAPFVFGFAGTFADVVTEVNTHMPSALFVDSFYELDRFTEPDDTKRTAIVVSRLQRMSREYDIPVLINTQANRATDKKRGADLSNISFSDTIGQTSDVVMTMNQSDEMRMSREMEIAILKNRGGRLAKVLANWNFEENDFTEIRELDESGEAIDTSERTNEDVEEEVDKFAKLLGRDKKKKVVIKEETGTKKKVVKKKKVEESMPWDDKPTPAPTKDKRVFKKSRGFQKTVA